VKRLINIIILLLFSAVSCSDSTHLDSIQEDKNIDRQQIELISYLENGLEIRDVSISNSTISISLSNEIHYSICLERILVAQIDETGKMLVNGELSDIDAPTSYDPRILYDGTSWIIEDSIIILPEQYYHNNSTEKQIIAVAESYKNWIILTNHNKYIYKNKCAATPDYDSILRSVNHRGYNISAPENTIPAYKLSKLMGFKYVETDVLFTKDGIPVLIHDDTIDRTSNGTGKIKDMTYNELTTYDFGLWKGEKWAHTKIPSFEEFIILCRNLELFPYVELKEGSKENIETLLSIIEKHEMKEKVTFISFQANILKEIAELYPDGRIGVLCVTPSEEYINSVKSLCNDRNEVFLDCNVYSAGLELCEQNNIPMEVWTYNDYGTIQNFPSYISGVTSDYQLAGRIKYENSLH